MNSSLVAPNAPNIVLPKLGTLPPERKTQFYFKDHTIHIPNGDIENRIRLKPLPKGSKSSADCEPVLVTGIHNVYVFDGKPNDYGIAKYICFQFNTFDKEDQPLDADLIWVCGGDGEVGNYSPTYKTNRVRVHTATLVLQFYELIQQGYKLQDLSFKLTVTPWTRSDAAVLFIDDRKRLLNYQPGYDTRPDVFTDRVNAIAESLNIRKPFDVRITDSDVGAPIPILTANESTSSH